MNTLMIILSIIVAVISLLIPKAAGKKKVAAGKPPLANYAGVGKSPAGMQSHVENKRSSGRNTFADREDSGENVYENSAKQKISCESETAIGDSSSDLPVNCKGNIVAEDTGCIMDEIYGLITCGYTADCSNWRDFTREGENFLAGISVVDSFSADGTVISL